MKDLIARIFRFKKVNSEVVRPDPTSIYGTMDAACRMSSHRYNRDGVIVVVDRGPMFSRVTGNFERSCFNFYTYRGNGDFNAMPNLLAAYVNGVRVDTPKAVSTRRYVLETRQPARRGSVGAPHSPEFDVLRIRPEASPEPRYKVAI